jgi:hypothetical protein
MSSDRDNQLAQIDSKLTALLALVLDSYLRETGVASPKKRSIDRMLTDAGLSASTIAGLLGKTERAVHLQLQRDAKRGRPAAERRR